MVQESGFKAKALGLRLNIKGLGFSNLCFRFRVQAPGFRVHGTVFEVQGTGFMVQGIWCTFRGSRLRVED
jgi:hypothetical protein